MDNASNFYANQYGAMPAAGAMSQPPPSNVQSHAANTALYSNIPTIGGTAGLRPHLVPPCHQQRPQQPPQAMHGPTTLPPQAPPHGTAQHVQQPYYYNQNYSVPARSVGLLGHHPNSLLKELPKASAVAVQKGNVLEIVPSHMPARPSATAVKESAATAAKVAAEKRKTRVSKTEKFVAECTKWKEEIQLRRQLIGTIQRSREKGPSAGILKANRSQSVNACSTASKSARITVSVAPKSTAPATQKKKKVFFNDGIYPDGDSSDEDRRMVEAKLFCKLKVLRKKRPIKAHLELVFKKIYNKENLIDPALKKMPPPPPPPGVPPPHLERAIRKRVSTPTPTMYYHYDRVVRSMYVSENLKPIPPRLAKQQAENANRNAPTKPATQQHNPYHHQPMYAYHTCSQLNSSSAGKACKSTSSAVVAPQRRERPKVSQYHPFQPQHSPQQYAQHYAAQQTQSHFAHNPHNPFNKMPHQYQQRHQQQQPQQPPSPQTIHTIGSETSTKNSSPYHHQTTSGRTGAPTCYGAARKGNPTRFPSTQTPPTRGPSNTPPTSAIRTQYPTPPPPPPHFLTHANAKSGSGLTGMPIPSTSTMPRCNTPPNAFAHPYQRNGHPGSAAHSGKPSPHFYGHPHPRSGQTASPTPSTSTSTSLHSHPPTHFIGHPPQQRNGQTTVPTPRANFMPHGTKLQFNPFAPGAQPTKTAPSTALRYPKPPHTPLLSSPVGQYSHPSTPDGVADMSVHFVVESPSGAHKPKDGSLSFMPSCAPPVTPLLSTLDLKNLACGSPKETAVDATQTTACTAPSK